MDKDKLLAEARRRFPIGTKYYNLNLIGERSDKNKFPDPLTIPNNVSFIFSDIKSDDGKYTILVIDDENRKYGWVYSFGKWAETINLKKQHEIYY